MIKGIEKVNATLDRMMASFSPTGQKRLLSTIARRLAAENRGRIAANVAPEGTPFEPRKSRKRGKKGIRGRMFSRLKSMRWLKVRSFPGKAQIAFVGGAADIARVHHYGLRDKIDRKHALQAKYPARPLLGITDQDESLVEDILLKELSEGLRG